jgi:hypothetical protein
MLLTSSLLAIVKCHSKFQIQCSNNETILFLNFLRASDSDGNQEQVHYVTYLDTCDTLLNPNSPKGSIQKKAPDTLIPPPAPSLLFEREESEGWVVTNDTDDTLPKSGTSLSFKYPPPQFRNMPNTSLFLSLGPQKLLNATFSSQRTSRPTAIQKIFPES